MKTSISVTVNGRDYQHEVEGRLLLVNYLRDVLRLTGAHVGCDTSSCGSCTVLLDGYAVKACTLLAAQVDGREVTTVEGLSDNAELHPLQEGFREEHGLQCGFCTPGMIMAAVQLLNENDDPSETEIREAIEGNYCRCTGYHNIVKSIQYAAKKARGRKLETVSLGGEEHEKEKKLGVFTGEVEA